MPSNLDAAPHPAVGHPLPASGAKAIVVKGGAVPFARRLLAADLFDHGLSRLNEHDFHVGGIATHQITCRRI